jgi:prophage maintenance system killer protein
MFTKTFQCRKPSSKAEVNHVERGADDELRKTIRYIDFDTLVRINKEAASLTADKHEYTAEDERRMRSLLKRVEEVEPANGRTEAEILEKASLLMYGIASGQHFHEGNKRTALVAGLAFLEMNGLTLDIKNPDLLAVVDKAGISAAGLNDVRGILQKLIRNV